MNRRTPYLLTVITTIFVLLLFWTIPAQAIAVKSAGIGVEDRGPDTSYSLKLVFFEKGGPYVANVTVSIRDSDGKEILNRVSAGPWLYVDLPQGDYFVEATRQDGQFQGTSIHIENEQVEAALQFDYFFEK